MSKTKPDSDIVERLKDCLTKAVDMFNRVDAATLLCPCKDQNGNDAVKGSPGWCAAGERAIAHRLAVYVEREVCGDTLLLQSAGPVVVDCEYNRHLDQPKTHRISDDLINVVLGARRKPTLDSDDDSFYVFSVAPDIVVHQRGTDDKNLLVIEVKKATNRESPEYDRLKLECFTKPTPGYGYQLGASVLVEDNVPPADRRLRPPKWFSNGVAE